MVYSIFYFLTLSALAFSSACAHESQKYQLYFWANYNQHEKQPNIAQQCYDILFKKHACPELYPGYLTHLAQTHQNDAIVRLLPIIENTIKKDIQTQLIFIQALHATGKIEESLARVKKLVQNYPENPELLYYATIMLAEQHKYNQALEYVTNYLKQAGEQSPKAFIFYFLKGQLYFRMNNNPEAIRALKKSLELFPEFDQALLLLGLIYEMMGDSLSALKNYKECSKIVGPNPMLEQQIMHLEIKNKIGFNSFTQDTLFMQIKTGHKHKYHHAHPLLQQSELVTHYNPLRLPY